MTRTISLIIGIAVVALVAVPTALGEGRLAGSQEPDGVAAFIANERATLAQQDVTPVSSYRDANERSNVLVAESPEQRADRLRGEGMNRLSRLGVFSNDNVASRSPEQRAERLRSEGLNKMYGLGDFASTSTGNDIEWPQIGIGLGIGIALMLGLLVAFRSTRQRPLAH